MMEKGLITFVYVGDREFYFYPPSSDPLSTLQSEPILLDFAPVILYNSICSSMFLLIFNAHSYDYLKILFLVSCI